MSVAFDPTTDREHTALSLLLHRVYEEMEGSEAMMDYSDRHHIRSAAVLTVYSDEQAALVAELLAPRITGKTVVEIGGGIGLLAFHLAQYAKRVYCIEANPMWSWTFATLLLKKKPMNVSYLFGSAQEFIGQITGDVAVFCTHSDAFGMRVTGRAFAEEVIDVYRDAAIATNPRLARLREFPTEVAGAMIAAEEGIEN